jgi:transposase-like protein
VNKTRKHYSGEEKVAILRRHLLEQEPVSKICDELGLQPKVFYRWQKEFFENGASTFQTKARADHQAERGTHRVPGEEDPAQRRGSGRTHRTKKRTWGTLNGVWVPHDVRDQIVDFVRRGRRPARSAPLDSLGG